MRSKARRPGLRRFVDLIMSVFALIGLSAVVGFIIFIVQIPHTGQDIRKADAIVVLTGGADRLNDAMTLLRNGRAGRLLISGVHPDTSARDLARMHPDSAALFSCCVDLDHQALNTAGNALTTKLWVEGNRYASVILVTSGWHMPRAHVELARSLPDVDIIPHPVITESFRDGSWWRNGETLTLVMGEYLKYVAALARVRLAPRVATGDSDIAQASH